MGKAAPAQRPNVDSEGHVLLQGELFWKWKATTEVIHRCEAEISVRSPKIDALLEQHPELKQLLGERASFIQQLHVAKHEYKGVLAQLEAHLGFSMANVSIDDVTGRVHRHEVAEATPPPAVTNGVNGHAKPRTIKPPPVASSATKAKKSPKKRK